MSTPTILEIAADVGRAGKNPLTPRWEATVRAFYGLPLRDEDVANLRASTRRTDAGIRGMNRRARRELWCRIGRRGRKSVVAALIGLFEAAFGGHEQYLIPGERGLIAIISKDTAGSTLVARFAEMHAHALGIGCHWTSIGAVRVLELDGFAFGIACFPCNARAPRGYAMPVIIADEIAIWPAEGDDYVNTDESVLSAIKPAMAQFPNAKLIAISSPLGANGLHYETVEANLGDDASDDVLAVEGPTWEWNPEITEERTRDLEKDPEVWACEFGAKPRASEGTAWVPGDVDGCYAALNVNDPEVFSDFTWSPTFAAIDPATRSNTFAGFLGAHGRAKRERRSKRTAVPGGRGLSPDIFVGTERDANGNEVLLQKAERDVLCIYRVFGWTGVELQEQGLDSVCEAVGRLCLQHNADLLFTDQHGDGWIQPAIKRVNSHVTIRSFRPTNEQIHEAVTLGRIWMRDGRLAITDPHDGMHRDLLTYPRRIVGGGFRYGERRAGGHHWDWASALTTALWAHLAQYRPMNPSEVSYLIQGSPLIADNRRTEIGG